MGKTIHVSLSVRGALRWDKRRLRMLAMSVIDEETAARLSTADQAKDFLMDALANGWEVLPMGTCEGFDRKTGCPGHTEATP